jgi:Na+/glutamate symporter
MNDFMMIVIHFIMVCALVFFGMRVERRWELSRYFISPPLLAGVAGTILLILLIKVTGHPLNLDPTLGRWLVTCFLFVIGFRIGMIYTWRHIRTLVVFTVLSTGLLVLLELISWALFNDHPILFATLGAMSFAWNDEWLGHAQMYDANISIVFHTSLLLVFFFTPLIIRLFSRQASPPQEENLLSVSFPIPLKWRVVGISLAVVVTFSACLIKYYWLDRLSFLFDFVLSMGIGVGIGLMFRGSRSNHPLVQSIGSLGRWSLYGFIVVMILNASHEVWLRGQWSIAGLLAAKLVVLSILFLGISRFLVRNHHHLVWASATWAFTLSAPVTCMNAMRSVADRYGEADDVILVVPPVILWLINYPHYLIFVWLYGTS